jgi:hypothetical protein
VYLSTTYDIEIIQDSAFTQEQSINIDGMDQEGKKIVLNDDSRVHNVIIKWNSAIQKREIKKLNVKEAGT